MVTTTRNLDEYELEDAVSFRRSETQAKTWDVPSSARHAAQSRYGRRRGKAAQSFNGAHRRRNKRNYL